MHKSNRILAAVMFTDMVGFTALMNTDEALARKKIDRHRQVIEEQHKKFEGKIINYFGDGTLSIFSSSVNAVDCAIEIQGQLKTPINVPVRIGIDVGDIVFEKGNILGEAVNIASRIESFSVPGAILISEAVYGQVKNHTHFQSKPLGQFYFKNIPKPSEVYAVSNPGLTVPDPSELKGKGHRETPSNEKFPKTLTTFLGREQEVEEICELLNAHRLITLTGPGGTGKTSLSVKVAWEVADRFPEGIFWMPLVSVKNTEAVAMECVSYLGLKEDPMLSSEDVLIAFFKEKKALLVLDNFEHVIKAAHVIDQLHKACTELSILVSSRIILQVQGEKEYQVPPFKVPKLNEANTLDELKETPSVALFTQRAQASRRNFTLTQENSKTVAEICVRLDGLPLGIELAAARTKIFSPESLLKRLNTSFDVLKGGGQFPPRHQTIRHTIAWSYDLLEMEEQLLFKCISLFVGGCTLEAIEDICGENELFHGDIVEGVMALVDKSLLSTDDSGNELRFFMLETINEFAREELGKSKEQTSIKKDYINYYLKLSEEASPHFYSSEAEVWNNIISPEQPNIRAAIDHAIESEDMALAYRFVKSLIPFWSSRGLTGDEGVQQLEKVTAVPVPESLNVERLKLKQSLASCYLYTLSRDKSEAIFEECLAYWRKQDDKNQLGLILNDIGWGHIVVGNFLEGEIYTEEARVIFERLSNKSRLVASLNSLGMLKMWQRKPLEALSFFEQTFVLTEELKDQRRNAQSILNTAYCNYLMGNYKLAEGQIEQALVTFRKNSSLIFEETALIWLCYIYYEYGAFDKCKELCIKIREIGEEANLVFGKGMAYSCMAMAEFGMGNLDLAKDLISKADKLILKGDKHFMYTTTASLASIEWDLGDLEMVKYCCQKLLSYEIEHGSYLGFIPGIEIAARIAAHEGHYKSAATLFFNAQIMRVELCTPIRKSEENTYQDLLKDLNSNLSPKEYTSAMADRKDVNQLLSLANDFI